MAITAIAATLPSTNRLTAGATRGGLCTPTMVALRLRLASRERARYDTRPHHRPRRPAARRRSRPRERKRREHAAAARSRRRSLRALLGAPGDRQPHGG